MNQWGLMSPVAPTADSITVRQTLDLLDNEFAATAAGVGERRYAFWVGSGISREKVVDVGQMLRQGLEHLRSNIDAPDDNCCFRRALDEALAMVSLTDAEKTAIRYDEPFETWAGNATAFAALEKLEPDNHKPYLRAHLYPARLVYSWMTGRMASNDDAVAFVDRHRPDGLDVGLVSRALQCRSEARDPDILFADRTSLPRQVDACARLIAAP